MPVSINVTTDIDKVMSSIARQYPKAINNINQRVVRNVSNLVKKAEEDEIRKTFNNPTPYTQKSIKIKYDRKNISATVWLKDRGDTAKGTAATDYLGPQITGGVRSSKRFERALQRRGLMPQGWRAVPGQGAKLDQYGNMSSGQIVQILSWFQSFSEQGYKANMTDKGKKRLAKGTKKQRGFSYFVVYPGSKWSRGKTPGVYSRTEFGFGSAVKPVLIYVRTAQYRELFSFERVANDIIAQHMPRETEEAIRIEMEKIRAN